jgi:hypothetical protein
MVQYVERDFNEIASIPFGECGNGASHPCLRKAQFATALPESAVPLCALRSFAMAL